MDEVCKQYGNNGQNKLRNWKFFFLNLKSGENFSLSLKPGLSLMTSQFLHYPGTKNVSEIRRSQLVLIKALFFFS